jgi:hypothetical protein
MDFCDGSFIASYRGYGGFVAHKKLVRVSVALVFGWSHCSIMHGPWRELQMLDQWAFWIYGTHPRWECGWRR